MRLEESEYLSLKRAKGAFFLLVIQRVTDKEEEVSTTTCQPLTTLFASSGTHCNYINTSSLDLDYKNFADMPERSSRPS